MRYTHLYSVSLEVVVICWNILQPSVWFYLFPSVRAAKLTYFTANRQRAVLLVCSRRFSHRRISTQHMHAPYINVNCWIFTHEVFSVQCSYGPHIITVVKSMNERFILFFNLISEIIVSKAAEWCRYWKTLDVWCSLTNILFKVLR